MRRAKRSTHDGAKGRSPRTPRSDRVCNRVVDPRQHDAGRHVQMFQALADGPGVRSRPPMKLLVVDGVDERVSVRGELLELTTEIVQNGSERKRHSLSGWRAREGRDGGVDPLA